MPSTSCLREQGQQAGTVVSFVVRDSYWSTAEAFDGGPDNKWKSIEEGRCVQYRAGEDSERRVDRREDKP